MHPIKPTIFAALYAYFFDVTMAEYLLHTFSGKIGGGNYTYYKLSKQGNVRLVMDSVFGDADLYVSDETLTPDYVNYELKSATCGEDEVYIPAERKRPVGVGVYGYSVYDTSHYQLHVYIDDTGGQNSPTFDSYSAASAASASSSTGQHKSSLNTPKDEEESLLWTIFVGILKIIFDILV